MVMEPYNISWEISWEISYEISYFQEVHKKSYGIYRQIYMKTWSLFDLNEKYIALDI